MLDKEQNYEALSGKLENGITTIKFRRQWFTCDKDDIEIRVSFTHANLCIYHGEICNHHDLAKS